MGEPDHQWKEVQYFDLFGTGVSIEMGRKPRQRATTLTAYDLGRRGDREYDIPASMGPENIRVSITPFRANPSAHDDDAPDENLPAL